MSGFNGLVQLNSARNFIINLIWQIGGLSNLERLDTHEIVYEIGYLEC